MTLGGFSLAVLRLAAIVVPAWIVAHNLRKGWLGVSDSAAVLAEVVLTLSVLLVAAELLGLVALDRTGALVGVLAVTAGLSSALSGRAGLAMARVRAPAAHPRSTGARTTAPAAPAAAHRGAQERGSIAAAVVCVLVVSAQWCVQTANALGSGMLNFDTLWYHMPFAARFAQTGSVTAIQFTQADPFVAYYPANSELFHALGLIALHGDFLSPLINLMWLAIALLAAWCLGRPWRVQVLTLAAGCLVVSLPVLSGTQPGEAFNDIAGLASLLAGAALAIDAREDTRTLVVAGLALGLAVGTKWTFLVPAFSLLVGLGFLAAARQRARALTALGAPLALTGGWWYLRDAIAVGNPLGLSVHLGPLLLPGPHSPLADASQQTVISELAHVSLWGSRFAPGLDHAFGPLWPLILALYLAAVVTGAVLVSDARVRVLALVAAIAGISYLLLPTGATGIERGTSQFQVNLRYATPALAIGILLVPVIGKLRASRWVAMLGPGLALLLLGSQLERSLWPTQTARHGAFLAACAVAAALVWWGCTKARALAGDRGRRALLACAALLLAGAAFAAQQHYYDRRYRAGDTANPALGAIYSWAQGVAHVRIALYGTVEQYPLYGARGTNVVDYLGAKAAHRGYRPIAACETWRRKLSAGRYAYVVLTPAPTRAVPIAWTAQDPAAALLLHPATDYYVFKLNRRAAAVPCA